MILPIDTQIKEIWVQINTWNPNVCPYYQVSNYGRVFNGSTNNFLPQNINYNKDKYINIRLKLIDGSSIQEMMQRIVMYVFSYIPNCENYEVNHKDGVKYHNWVWNLEWTTHIDNMNHAWENNLFKFGEERLNAKLTNEQAEDICLMLSHGIKPKEIAEIYQPANVNVEKIAFNIMNKRSWKHISNNYDIPRGFGRGKSSTTNERKIITPIEI